MMLLSVLISPGVPDMTAPPVPDSGVELMPQRAGSFSEGLWELLRDAVASLEPELAEAAGLCLGVIAVVLLLSILQSVPGSANKTAEFVGAVGICTVLLGATNSMIHLGTETITEISTYGKLLMGVMASAMAAQGGVSASGAIYAGTAVFDTVLIGLISRILVPLIYIFLALSTATAALGEDVLKKMSGFIKWLCTWCLKTILYVFTGYIGITGVVSGTTDAAALKAAKLTISGMVPVVGGILSDASEAVLVGAGVVKNAAGIYGILAILAVFTGPFLRIGCRYLLLKLTGAVCAVFGPKRCTDLIGEFTAAMGLVLAMTGSVCLLMLISTVCFLKGVG